MIFGHYPLPDPLRDVTKDAPELPTGTNEDGKSLKQLPATDKLSPWYDGYPEVFADKHRANAFDFHVYYAGERQMDYARKLHERIRREFPELRIYKFWDKPVGPHPVPMFEVNTFTPAQFAALFGFLVAYRGPLSVLIHPNTDDEYRDHTERATWMGERYPLVPFPGLGLPKPGAHNE